MRQSRLDVESLQMSRRTSTRAKHFAHQRLRIEAKSAATMRADGEKKSAHSLGNVFNHIGLECEFELNVVALGEAIALGVYQCLVACRVDLIQVGEDFSAEENAKELLRRLLMVMRMQGLLMLEKF